MQTSKEERADLVQRQAPPTAAAVDVRERSL
jgi:hypothetical protein